MLDHLDPFRRRSVALGLYRMLTGPRFSISVVREALSAAGLNAPDDRLSALRLHHCESYAEMPPGFHAELASATLALFTGRPVLPPLHGGEGDGFLKDLATAAGLRPDEVVWEGDAVARTSEGDRGKEREAGDAPASAMQRDAATARPQPSAARALPSRSTSTAPSIQALVPLATA